LPALGTTYIGGNAELLRRILPLVEFLEVTPDTVARVTWDDRVILDERTLCELKDISRDVGLIAHGVGLSIGSSDGWARWSEQYFYLLDSLLNYVPVKWHSEHLGYTMVEGEFVGTMLALPRTESVLDTLCERVLLIQERYSIDFLLENIVHLLPDYGGQYTEPAFLNTICERSGCGLVLDVYNLQCDAFNHRVDIERYLSELDMRYVRELHLAHGVKHRGFMLDVHSRTTADSTIALARQIVALAANLQSVTFELLPEAVPSLGCDEFVAEISRLRAAL
jgi:uncharacterized protein (UPF0276 family)